MARIEPRYVKHLTYCRKGLALKVDNGTPMRRNHRNLLEINLNAFARDLRKLKRTWPDWRQIQRAVVRVVAIDPLARRDLRR
jgi:hypothetical protein